MGIRVKVVVRDKVGKDFRIEERKRIENLAEKDTFNCALAAQSVVQATIARKAKNPTGYLASFFTAQKIPNGWGVGDVDELDTQAPYWNHVDKGSVAIGANWEHTLPKGRWFGGVWIEDDSGYFAKPSKPITALNYIDDSLATLDILIPQILKGNK